jgi:polyisoprenoid-binding protein YceI
MASTFVRSSIVGPAALLLAMGAGAAPTAETLLPAQSAIDFTVKQMGVPVQGHFGKFSAQVAFDPKQPAAARIALAIDLGSATMGAPEADAELPKPTWFDAAHFPQAKFQSTAVKATAPGHLDVSGTLTIKGVSRPLTVPVVLTQAGGVTTATGGFALKRLDFKIGEGEWADTSMVANDVQVHFKLALQGVPAL